MKERYILAAAHDWNGEIASHPLPAFIPDSKFREIHMLRPAFHNSPPLSNIKLFSPAHPNAIRAWISIWQERSRMLSAWIDKAKCNIARVPNCSWKWPASPISFTPINYSDLVSDSEELASTTTEASSLFEGENTQSTATVHVNRAEVSTGTLKRSRESSPLDVQRDGTDANKKQLVLWRPSLAQLLERQRALIDGEVPTGHSLSNSLSHSSAVDGSSIHSTASGPLDSLAIHAPSFIISPHLQSFNPHVSTSDPRLTRNHRRSQPPRLSGYSRNFNCAGTSQK